MRNWIVNLTETGAQHLDLTPYRSKIGRSTKCGIQIHSLEADLVCFYPDSLRTRISQRIWGIRYAISHWIYPHRNHDDD